MSDQGEYMFPQYCGRWIPDSPARRRAILERMRSFNPFSLSSPVNGIEKAIRVFQAPDKRISVYVFGDDFTGNSIEEVVDTVDRHQRTRRERQTSRAHQRRRHADAVSRIGATCFVVPVRRFDARTDVPQRRHVRRPVAIRVMMSGRLSRFAVQSAVLPSMRRFVSVCLIALTLGGCTGANVQMQGEIPDAAGQSSAAAHGSVSRTRAGAVRVRREDPGPRRLARRSRSDADEAVPSDRVGDVPRSGAGGLSRAGGANLDAVLAPSIVEFQISIPSQTRSEFYEVWIKYMMRLYDTHGTLIAEWPLTAYGKANRGDFGFMENSDSPAIRQATHDGVARCRRIPRAAIQHRSGSARLVEFASRLPEGAQAGGPT